MPSQLFFSLSFAFSCLFCLVGLVFSTMMVIAFIIQPACRNATNLLICNTSVVGATYFINTMIASIYGFREDWAINQPLCQFRAYCFLFSCGAICYSYLIIAVSRLFLTVYFHKQNLLTYRVHVYLMIFNWILPLILATEPWFFSGGYIYEEESRLCTFTTKTFHTSFVGVTVHFLIPLTLALLIYIIIFIQAKKSSRRVGINARDTLSHPVLNMKRELKLMRNMVILMLIFAAGGTPFLILVLWQGINPSNTPPDVFYLWNNNAISFFVAAMIVTLFFMNKQFRDVVLIYFK